MKTLFLLCLLSSPCFSASLTRFSGNVSINDGAVVSPQKVKAGDKITAQGPKSFFIIRYENGSRFMVRDGGIQVLKDSPKNKKIDLIKGVLFAYLKPKSKQNLEVLTKSAVMAVRGTKFLVSEDPKDTYLCVCEGAVEIKNSTGSMSIAKGQDIHVKSKKSKLKMSGANSAMWTMAQEGFSVLDLKIPELN